MKEVAHRGGLVTFSIPATWVEDAEPDGGGMYYLDAPDSGTLRVNVLTFQHSGAAAPSTSADLLAGTSSARRAPIRSLPNGNAICEYSIRSEDDGEQITLYWWEVANVVPPRHARIASFSYTVLTAQEGSDPLVSELGLLRSSFEALRFHPEIGL